MTHEEILKRIDSFLDKDKKLIALPKKRKELIPAMMYISGKFQFGKEYTEEEVNQILNDWHSFEDPDTLRRLLYEFGFMERRVNGENYKLMDPPPSFIEFDDWISGFGF